MRWREFATPVQTDSWVEAAGGVLSTLLGTMGLTQGVTDNASVNVVPQASEH